MLIEKLNDEQRVAVEAIVEFLKGEKTFFLLKGHAGAFIFVTPERLANI